MRIEHLLGSSRTLDDDRLQISRYASARRWSSRTKSKTAVAFALVRGPLGRRRARWEHRCEPHLSARPVLPRSRFRLCQRRRLLPITHSAAHAEANSASNATSPARRDRTARSALQIA